MLRRRQVLASLALLGGCATPLPPMANPVSGPAARALLDASAAAHGLAALRDVRDISVSYTGSFHALIGTLQPALVDAGFRGRSQERLLLRDGLVAQAHTGPDGQKQVLRHAPGEVSVWFNGVESQDPERRAAAALVADDYSVFLLGPMLLSTRPGVAFELAEPTRITVDGVDHGCDVLRARLLPGLGFAPSDQLALYIGQADRLMHRVRFTVDGLDSTQGAVAEVDTWAHIQRAGLQWPTRFQERLLRPLPLAVHDWHMDGLDLNRSLTPGEVSGPTLQGSAIPPAAKLPG